jgi:hypothetical protein
MKTIHSYLLVIALAFGLVVHAASAFTSTWNAASGNWSESLKWSPMGDPNGTGFDVIFNNGGSLTLDGGRTVGTYSQTLGTFTFGSGQALILNSAGALDGGGVMSLGNINTKFYNLSPNVVFTNSAGTIRGSGQIGYNPSNGLSVLNQANGIIQADIAGEILYLNGSGTFTNNGLMRAQGGGILILDGSSSATFINNAIIRSENGSSVTILFSKIVGGTLDNTGSTGTITLNDGTLRDVTIAAGSTVTTGGNRAGYLENMLINHGTLAPAPSSIFIASDTTLSGGGVIALLGNLSSVISNTGSNRTLTNTDNTLRGTGLIGYDSLSVINGANGIIQADVPGQVLYLNGSGTFTNNGLMRAQNGGTLILDGSSAGVFNNNATIRSENGSNVSIVFSKLVGGTLDNTGSTGTITLNDGTLRDVTIAAGSTVTTGGNRSGYLENTLVNHGTLAPAPASIFVASDTTLSGGGIIALASLNSRISNAGTNRTLTNGDNVLHGTGHIGYDSLSVINGAAGIIQADVSGETLHLNGSGNFTNNGLMRASNGGILYFSGTGTITNSGGTLHVLPTSIIKGDGGIIQTAGTIDLDGGNMNFPLGIDLNGGQLIGNGTFTGPIRNNGGIVGPGHSPGKIMVNGDYTQGGTGTLNIEIGGAAAGTGYDQLQVSGTAALGGTLNLGLINGFLPSVGDVFAFILPSAFTGAFSTINTTGFTGQVNYSASAITITVLSVGGGTPTPTPTPGATPSRLLNIATRMRVQTGENVLIGGFIINGTDSKNVIIRGIGPSLSSFFSGVLANPTLELFQGNTLLQSNNDWKDTQRVEIEATGLQPGNDSESAIVRTLLPGSYTAIVRGFGDTTGIGVVEAYDLNQTANSKFANIATRGFVDAGDNVMIGGLIIGPASGSTAKVVVRAIGPSLTAFGIAGALQDPTVDLKDANGTTLLSNNDWQQGQAAEIQQLGLAPGDIRESALVTTLSPGAYTAIVRGVGNTTGVGLVEVYNVQ